MFFTNKRCLLLILVVLALIITACGQGSQPAAPADSNPTQSEQAETAAETNDPTGGTVRIGINGSPDTLNPGTAILSEAYDLFEIVYDSMYDLQLDGNFTLSLAESAEVSEDGTVWTFKIHPDIKFHDGQPLTAKDIAFSYNFYQAHEDFPYLNSYTGYFVSAEAPDDQK